jgi:hypothetical protein
MKAPMIMRGIGRNNIRNKVALTGGNAFVLVTKDSNFFTGTVFYEADAYKCKF